MPLSSDPSSRVSEDLRATEERLFENEDDSWLTDAQLFEKLEQNRFLEAGTALSGPHHAMPDLKVEVPLVPLETVNRPQPSLPDLSEFKDWIDIAALDQGCEPDMAEVEKWA